MDIQLSERLKKLPPYLFADLRRKMREAQDRGVKVVRIDIGDPDFPAPKAIEDELVRAAQDAEDNDRCRYGCDRPVPALKQSFQDFYKRRYNVTLADDQIITTMGSKDAIAKLPMAIMNPGDLGIAPVPGYPTYNIGHVFAGAVTHQVPLLKENGFLVDFDAIPLEVRRQAKILWINYPNNPTTAVAPMEFFERAVEFGRKNDILIAHDSAYSENTYDGYKAPSILQVPGAEEVAVEFFSLSKAFSMTGWRMGSLAGNASAVAALGKVKDNVDNGTPRPVQYMAAKALEMADELIPPINEVYKRRRDLVVDALNAAGWSLEKPKATIYVWAPVPEKYEWRQRGVRGGVAGEDRRDGHPGPGLRAVGRGLLPDRPDVPGRGAERRDGPDHRDEALVEVRLESTDGPGRVAEVWVGGTLLTVMDDYTQPADRPEPGVLADAMFAYMTEEAFTWDEAVAGNRAQRQLLDPVRQWRYVGYGQIVQVMPVVIDFGLMKMEDSNWTNDEKLVGKFVRVPIDRLSLTREDPERWPAELR